MKLTKLCLGIALLLSCIASAQEEPGKKDKKPKKPKAGDIVFSQTAVKVEDASVARQHVTRFVKEFKANKKDVPAMVKSLQRLGKWDHTLILGEAKKHIKHREFPVAVEAVRVCVSQTADTKKTGKALYAALKKEKRTNVVCALIVGLGILGRDDKFTKKECIKYFKRDTTESHKAAARYIGYIKDRESFRMLAERLDEPAPKRPDDPTNPPASYWRERWHEWETNVPHVRWAMSQLVPGETFESTREAKEWARTEGRKFGIKW